MASGSFNHRKFLCPEFIIGNGAMNSAGNFSMNLEAKKVLIVTDKGLMNDGRVDRIETPGLGRDYSIGLKEKDLPRPDSNAKKILD